MVNKMENYLVNAQSSDLTSTLPKGYEKEQTGKVNDPFTDSEFKRPLYCPCCFTQGDRQDAWSFMSEATHEYLSVRAQCRGCGGEWWAVYSLMSITPSEVNNNEC